MTALHNTILSLTLNVGVAVRVFNKKRTYITLSVISAVDERALKKNNKRKMIGKT